jgi:hypothetical protein
MKERSFTMEKIDIYLLLEEETFEEIPTPIEIEILIRSVIGSKLSD